MFNKNYHVWWPLPLKPSFKICS